MNKTIEDYLPFIVSRCRSIRVPGFEKDDIVQEATVAVLEYLRACEKEKIAPSDGAVKNVIHRHFFKLIRNNVTFEGCTEQSKHLRRSISQPFSNNMRIYDDSSDSSDTVDLFENRPNNTESPYDLFSNADLIDKFKCILTPTESLIFEYMLAGNSKPRHICQDMYGERSLCASKTISNHMIKIRRKFETFWREHTGRVICLN